jgi:large-conductance mechanosensitive channel
LYKFYDTTNTKITSAVVIGILVFGVIVSFNTNIVTPFIQAMIPNYNWNRSITLRSYNTTDSSGRPVRINVEMYPSLFIQSIIAFFITLLVVFSIAEISTMISNTFLRNYINTIFKFSSMILLLLLLIWNIYERFNLTDVMVCKVPNEKVDFKVV